MTILFDDPPNRQLDVSADDQTMRKATLPHRTRRVGAMSNERLGHGGYVALSRFEVRPGWEDAVAAAFRDRPRLVERASGFLRLDVLRPVHHPTEFWLITYWTHEAAFREWHRSHDRRSAHQGMPAGLRLIPGSAEIIELEHVTS